MFKKKKVCPICGHEYEGNGNYALPVINRLCCDVCNGIVTKARSWNVITVNDCRPALLVTDGYKDAFKEYFEAALFAFQHGLYILGTITTKEIMEMGVGNIIEQNSDYLCVNDYIINNPENTGIEIAAMAEGIQEIGYKVHILNQLS